MRRVNVAILWWNPAIAGYTGAALVVLAVFAVFGYDAPWPLVLLGIVAGFIAGMWMATIWRGRQRPR